MNLVMSLRAKGATGLAARVGTIASRFGVTDAKLARAFSQFTEITEEADARPTLPITATVLARHAGLIRRFQDRGVEFAIHGLVHYDHAVLDLPTQRDSIARAREIFRAASIDCAGFRGPYLRANPATARAVQEAGLRYHSSQAVAFDALPLDALRGGRGAAYRRVLDFYGARDATREAVRPRLNNLGLVDIPVAVPDDEIMVDRLRLTPDDQAAVWAEILRQTHQQGDLFTVQLHPERVWECARPLSGVLRAARAHGAGLWIATLSEIAVWWRERAATRVWLAPSSNGWRISLRGNRRATLWQRTPHTSWHHVGAMQPNDALTVTGPVQPCVGVSEGVSLAVRGFLAEEGYLIADATADTPCGAYLDERANSMTERDLLTAVETAPGPLVRLGRWPDGAASALAVTGDIDCITVQDFLYRVREARVPRTAVPRPAPEPARAAVSTMNLPSAGD